MNLGKEFEMFPSVEPQARENKLSPENAMKNVKDWEKPGIDNRYEEKIKKAETEEEKKEILEEWANEYKGNGATIEFKKPELDPVIKKESEKINDFMEKAAGENLAAPEDINNEGNEEKGAKWIEKIGSFFEKHPKLKRALLVVTLTSALMSGANMAEAGVNDFDSAIKKLDLDRDPVSDFALGTIVREARNKLWEADKGEGAQGFYVSSMGTVRYKLIPERTVEKYGYQCTEYKQVLFVQGHMPEEIADPYVVCK